MHDEIDALGGGNTDLEQPRRLVGTDQHRETVEFEHSDWVAVGVEHLFVGDPVLPRARQDDRSTGIKLP